MVRDVDPVLPDPPELLLLLLELPHAATPNASATVRQLDAATELTRKRYPPQGTVTKVRPSLYRSPDMVQRTHH